MAAPTIADLADIAQIHLGDSGAATWPQATVEQWMTEAIRDYGRHFPRTLTETINCATGTNNYDLPLALIRVVRVEYPTGNDPPDFLAPYPRNNDDFWNSDDYYDVEYKRDVSDADELWISPDPTTGEDIEVTYTADHLDTDAPSQFAPSTACTVPYRHYDLLYAFVIWKAFTERVSVEIQNPDTSIALIKDMQGAATEARKAYIAAIKDAELQEPGSGFTRPWPADTFDRIY